MKAYRIIGVLVVAALVCGCKGKKDKDESQEDSTEMARGTFKADKNIVTVEPLALKTFNKQLICNGKLEAQSKLTVQFESQGKIAQVNVRDGQKIQKGQILASLDKEQPRRQLEQARLAFDKAEMNLADRLLD